MAEGQGCGTMCFAPTSSCALSAALTLEEQISLSRARPRLNAKGVCVSSGRTPTAMLSGSTRCGRGYRVRLC